MARSPKAGRNDKCPCGSGKKHKHCCAAKGPSPWTGRIMMGLILAMIVGAVAAGLLSFGRHSSYTGAAPGRVWSAEHGHYH
jgi:hypothetical protein